MPNFLEVDDSEVGTIQSGRLQVRASRLGTSHFHRDLSTVLQITEDNYAHDIHTPQT